MGYKTEGRNREVKLIKGGMKNTSYFPHDIKRTTKLVLLSPPSVSRGLCKRVGFETTLL